MRIPKALSLSCALFAALASIALLGPDRLAERDSKSGFMSVELFWPDFSALPPESILLHSDTIFSATAIQSIYSARPDVSVIHWPSLYMNVPSAPLIPQRLPMAAFPLDNDGHPLSQYVQGYYSLFLAANAMSGKPVFAQYDDDATLLANYMKPDASFLFLARILPREDAGRLAFQHGDYDKLTDRLLSYIGGVGPSSDPPLSPKAPSFIYAVAKAVAGLAIDNGRGDLALKLINGFASRFTRPDGRLMMPWNNDLDAQAFLIVTLFNLKRHQEALMAAETLVQLDPASPNALNFLAAAQYNLDLQDEALETMAKAVEMDKFDLGFAIRYAKLLAKRRSLKAAAAFLSERSLLLKKEGMANGAKALDDFAACLSLPPENPGPLASPASMGLPAGASQRFLKAEGSSAAEASR